MHRLKEGSKVVGAKQTLRALEKGHVQVIYIAEDAQKQVTVRIVDLAQQKAVPIVYVPTMEELAQACNVEVKTATAALIDNHKFTL